MKMTGVSRSLVKINRYCACLLFFLILLYFITGYGQTEGIIDPDSAKLLHGKWLPVPTFAAFLLHSLLNIKFILMRKGVKDRPWWNIYLLVLGLVILATFLYIHLS
ncbi:MAG: hypothetical protein V2A66_09270 [Pseudomonadota bacterium]